jgi:hypothetical protein
MSPGIVADRPVWQSLRRGIRSAEVVASVSVRSAQRLGFSGARMRRLNVGALSLAPTCQARPSR